MITRMARFVSRSGIIIRDNTVELWSSGAASRDLSPHLSHLISLTYQLLYSAPPPGRLGLTAGVGDWLTEEGFLWVRELNLLF